MRKQLLLWLILLSAFTGPIAYSQQHPNPPKITGVSQGGVGFVTVTQGANGINASIGEWDEVDPQKRTPILFEEEVPLWASIGNRTRRNSGRRW